MSAASAEAQQAATRWPPWAIAVGVAGYLALHDVSVIVDGWTWRWPVRATFGALPWYALWLPPLLLATLAAPTLRTQLVPPCTVWTRRTLAVTALVLLAVEAMYGFVVVRGVTGISGLRAELDVALLLTAALAAPFVEEWLFRGVLWNLIAGPAPSRQATLAALLLTSLLFGAWHWPSLRALSLVSGSGTVIFVHIAFGVAMGVLRIHTRSLALPMLTHGLWNGLSVALTFPTWYG